MTLEAGLNGGGHSVQMMARQFPAGWYRLPKKEHNGFYLAYPGSHDGLKQGATAHCRALIVAWR